MKKFKSVVLFGYSTGKRLDVQLHQMVEFMNATKPKEIKPITFKEVVQKLFEAGYIDINCKQTQKATDERIFYIEMKELLN